MLLIDFALAKIDTFSEAAWLAAARPWPDARARCIVLPAQREMPVGYRFYTLRLWSRPWPPARVPNIAGRAVKTVRFG